MATVVGTNTLTISFAESLVYGIGQAQSVPIPAAFRSLFTSSGVLLNQCNLIYCTTLSLAASTPQSLDLTNLVDIFGQAVDFARVRFFAIRNNSQVDGANLAVGESGTNDWTGLSTGAATSTITVYPSTTVNDGFSIFQMPNSTGAVVSSTSKIVKLNPGTNAFTVDLCIAGCNA